MTFRSIVFFLAALWAMPCLADDGLPSLAVQNRKHTETHEFTAYVGVLPMDAFTKGLTLSGSYTLHFSDLIGWEVGQFFYSQPFETDLESELRAFDLKPTPFERVEQFVTSNVVFKPLYWKGAWLNSALSYGEFFLTAGGGYGWLTRTERPVASFGGGFRMYVNQFLSFRLDLRDLLFISENDTQNELWVGLGVSISP
ncbi:MAG: outer membrane beta-barrel domain-containing protein [Myxococcota bacterium]|nr:outer membrane beta-barrel domain-containing protein [Myxococcota bacterium]